VKVLLENKVAIVTGATGGLGRVVVKKLLESGAQVVASYRDEGKLAELLRFVGDFRDKVTAVKSDVTDEDSVKSFVQKTVEKHGRVDILFNIVGAYAGGTDVVNTEEDTWNMMMNVNLKSAFLCSKAVLPLMIRQNYGRMVNVSSWMAFEKNRRVKSAAYAVSKAGLVVLTETLALEVKNYDINVNCVAPSTIDTPSNRRNMPKADPSKWVDPKDIAEVMIFLVSDKSKVVSGASVPVYGKV
jgi:NAD(P)-dependent dehydrogenase (short-subunit alcohol dehydrogenase family)